MSGGPSGCGFFSRSWSATPLSNMERHYSVKSWLWSESFPVTLVSHVYQARAVKAFFCYAQAETNGVALSTFSLLTSYFRAAATSQKLFLSPHFCLAAPQDVFSVTDWDEG